MAPGQRADADRIVGVGIDLLGQDAGLQRVAGGPLEDGQGGFELGRRGRPGDEIIRQPQRADEPRVARHGGDVVADAVIIIILVARHPADASLDPQFFLHRAHGRNDTGVVGVEEVEFVDGVERGVDDLIDFVIVRI